MPCFGGPKGHMGIGVPGLKKAKCLKSNLMALRLHFVVGCFPCLDRVA